jgi:nitroreductase
MKDVPILLFVCGQRDWPFGVRAEERVGLAPPSYGSVYPCIQNILLACRGLGLGASLTTIHQIFEQEIVDLLDIPKEFGIVAVIPIGYPLGKFGPVGRRPPSEQTFFERWGRETS